MDNNNMDNNSLIEIYNCGCRPGFVYKSKQSFRAHNKSAHHLYWQCQQENKHLKEKIVELENKNSSLKIECNIWKEQAIKCKRKYEPEDFLLD